MLPKKYNKIPPMKRLIFNFIVTRFHQGKGEYLSLLWGEFQQERIEKKTRSIMLFGKFALGYESSVRCLYWTNTGIISWMVEDIKPFSLISHMLNSNSYVCREPSFSLFFVVNEKPSFVIKKSLSFGISSTST